ncbi:unnamed protein product [Prorocentrum cordatum]|uniref:Uncharacterized protein n=1 Tax=Prorocentrum cordatum TaxID=2364126 RepID=A0ABN9RSN3_9DINO|nr:unnamed protein product [Polarella glacialis]
MERLRPLRGGGGVRSTHTARAPARAGDALDAPDPSELASLLSRASAPGPGSMVLASVEDRRHHAGKSCCAALPSGRASWRRPRGGAGRAGGGRKAVGEPPPARGLEGLAAASAWPRAEGKASRANARTCE